MYHDSKNMIAGEGVGDTARLRFSAAGRLDFCERILRRYEDC